MSPRVDGIGEISPVEGVAENSEFDCAPATEGTPATRASASTGHSRPRTVAVADALSMTVVFSAQIAAISSHTASCLRLR
jgi:hypothetical protein